MSIVLIGVLFGTLVVAGSLAWQVRAQELTGADDEAAWDMLGRLNDWRLDEGLPPFRRNDTLDALADYQASYLITSGNIPDGSAIHIGRDGEGVRQRARYDDFDWPVYRTAPRIHVEEIAAVRSPEGAIRFWQTSAVHRRAATNPVYREIGIAAYPHPYGYLYVVVMGARPNVLTALRHPETDELYLTYERSRYADQADWITDVMQVRFFDEAGRPLGAPVAFDEVLPLPDGAADQDQLYVMFLGDAVDVVTEVDLARDIVVLPGYVPPPPEDAVFVVLTPTATPGPTVTPTPPPPELVILYDQTTLTVLNDAAYPVNLGYLSFRGVDDTLSFQWWTHLRDVPLYTFPTGDCLLAWSFEVSSRQPAEPRDCDVMRSGRSNLRASEMFWLEGDFDVLEGGRVIGTCEADAGRCLIDLPNEP